MEKSPYDPTPEDAFQRNQKRLKEELAEYEANCALLETYLAEADLTWSEVRGFEGDIQAPKGEKKHPAQGWLRI